jgi:hypothetical protein
MLSDNNLRERDERCTTGCKTARRCTKRTCGDHRRLPPAPCSMLAMRILRTVLTQLNSLRTTSTMDAMRYLKTTYVNKHGCAPLGGKTAAVRRSQESAWDFGSQGPRDTGAQYSVPNAKHPEPDAHDPRPCSPLRRFPIVHPSCTSPSTRGSLVRLGMQAIKHCGAITYVNRLMWCTTIENTKGRCTKPKNLGPKTQDQRPASSPSYPIAINEKLRSSRILRTTKND